jgi:hypothetical protein
MSMPEVLGEMAKDVCAGKVILLLLFLLFIIIVNIFLICCKYISAFVC